MHKYNQMVANYNVFSKKMEKITLNIFMRIRYKDLQRSFDELRKEIDNLKLKYHKNQSISENIILANNLTDNFEINYIDSVNAALCFGWIDSTLRNINGSLILRFSPRKKKSHWTETNINRCIELDKKGLMTLEGKIACPYFN